MTEQTATRAPHCISVRCTFSPHIAVASYLLPHLHVRKNIQEKKSDWISFFNSFSNQTIWLRGGKKPQRKVVGIYCATGLSWPGFTRKIRLKLEGNVYFVFWVSQRTECALDIKSWALVALTTVSWSPRTPTPHQTQSRMARVSSAHSRYHNSSVKSVGQKKVMEFPASTFKIKLYKPIAFYTNEPASRGKKRSK